MSESISSLLGEEPHQQFKANICDLVSRHVAQEVYLHHMHVHEYGNHKELTFHIMLPYNMPLKEAHNIADTLEQVIRQKMNIETTIHVEPLAPKIGENV